MKFSVQLPTDRVEPPGEFTTRDAIVEMARGREGPLGEADLKEILEEQSARGLRYLAIARPDGEILVEVGQPEGIRFLRPGTFEVLQAWLSRRSVIRVDLPPFCHLKPAPWGIREAAGETDRIVVRSGEGRLGHLKC